MKISDPWELTRGNVLSEAEAIQLLRSLRGHATDRPSEGAVARRLDELIVRALLFSGLRNSEFCALRMRDVEIAESRQSFTVGKRGRGRRTVYLPAALGRLIRRFINETRPELLPEGVQPNDQSQPLVFNENRKPFERNGLYRRVVRVLKNHGMGEKASVRLLRHSYGYLAYLRTGGNLLFVQRQLGHAHPRVTAVYAKLVDESYPELADRVGGLAELDTPVPKPAPQRQYAKFDCEID